MTTSTDTTTQELLPLAIYARVSRVNGREGESFHSPKLQRKEGLATAERFGLPVLPGTYLDVNRSGGSFDREHFQAILGMIEAGQCGGIIATRLDRISRADLPEAVDMLTKIERAGGVIYTTKGPVPSLVGDDPNSLLVIIELWAAHRERKDRGRYANQSRQRAIQDGSAHLFITYGYQREGNGSKRLVPNPAEAPTVQHAFHLRGDLDWSWNRIAQELNTSWSLPRPSKAGRQSRWTHKVRQLILKRTYLGLAHSGAFTKEHAHQALVSQELWDQWNQARGAGRVDLTGGQGYLLSGLVRCSSCGHVMVHSRVGGRRYYRCLSQAASGACPGPVSIPADELEYVAQVLFHQSVFTSHPQPIRPVETSHDLEELRAALREAQEQHTRAGRLILRQELAGAAEGSLDYLLTEADQAVKAAALALADGERQAQGMHLPSGFSPSMWADADVEQRRRWLGSAFGAVVALPGTGWRQPVAERIMLLTREQVQAEPITAAREAALAA